MTRVALTNTPRPKTQRFKNRVARAIDEILEIMKKFINSYELT